MANSGRREATPAGLKTSHAREAGRALRFCGRPWRPLRDSEDLAGVAGVKPLRCDLDPGLPTSAHRYPARWGPLGGPATRRRLPPAVDGGDKPLSAWRWPLLQGTSAKL